jgi:membrane protease YdiL (CAAX protease family)
MLGFGFAMMREWRGSLIAPMVAHFLHNATIMTFAILFFGSVT